MRKIGWLSVLLGLLAYVVIAVAGHVVAYLYQRHGPIGGGRLRSLFELYVGRQTNPFPAGFLGEVRGTFVLAWLVGLATGIVVLTVFVLVSSSSGSATAVFTGAWLGTILGTALAGVVASVITISTFVGSSSRFATQTDLQVFGGLQHGLYWGAVAGVLVGLAALLGSLGRRRRRPYGVPLAADSSPVQAR